MGVDVKFQDGSQRVGRVARYLQEWLEILSWAWHNQSMVEHDTLDQGCAGQVLPIGSRATYHGHSMSIISLPQGCLYWTSDKFFNVQEISNAMSLFRGLQQITCCLHQSHNSKMPKKILPNFHRCCKLRPQASRKHTGLTSMSLLTSLWYFAWPITMKQYVPLKPKIEPGYEVWSPANSETGYLCKFDFYKCFTVQQPT